MLEFQTVALQSFTLLADTDRPFPEDIEGELPVEIVLGSP
jgi:hypothetical protein